MHNHHRLFGHTHDVPLYTHAHCKNYSVKVTFVWLYRVYLTGECYTNFPFLITTLIVPVLHIPDCKGILVTANYGQMQRQHGVQQMNLLQPVDFVPFFCHVNCKTRQLFLACVPFPVLRATSIVAILQGPDDKDSG